MLQNPGIASVHSTRLMNAMKPFWFPRASDDFRLISHDFACGTTGIGQEQPRCHLRSLNSLQRVLASCGPGMKHDSASKKLLGIQLFKSVGCSHQDCYCWMFELKNISLEPVQYDHTATFGGPLGQAHGRLQWSAELTERHSQAQTQVTQVARLD